MSQATTVWQMPIEKKYVDLDGREVYHLRGREAAIDLGNAEVKAIFGSERSSFSIPNVLCEMEFGALLEAEDSIFEGIRVHVDSPALSRKWGTLAVGKLAGRQENRTEVEVGQNKSENDQSLILLFVSMAIDAVQKFPIHNKKVEATYVLSIGLPIHEFKDKNLRKEFKRRLKDGVHTVTFLEQTTSDYAEIQVQIQIFDVKLNSEGKAAHTRLVLDNFGRPRNLPAVNGTYMIHDDGGGTADVAIILAGGKPDNERSHGERTLGSNAYLEKIMSELRETYGENVFESRKELADHLLKTRETDPTTTIYEKVYIRGKQVSIDDIVNKHLKAYAAKVYEYMKRKWREVARLQGCYFIGGASSLIRPHLQELNGGAADGEYSIYFLSPNESFWILAEAYYLAGRHFQQRNKKQKIILLPPA